MDDQLYLQKAIEVGNQIPVPYNFGAVVVRNSEILSIEHNHVQEQNDPSLHAEVSAIVAACQKEGSNHIDGAVLYASHEPVEVTNPEIQQQIYKGTLQASKQTGVDIVPPIAKIPAGPYVGFTIKIDDIHLLEYGWGDNFANTLKHANDPNSTGDPM